MSADTLWLRFLGIEVLVQRSSAVVELDESPCLVVLDDARVVHLREVTLVETDVHTLPLLGVQLSGVDVVFDRGDVFGQLPDGRRVGLVFEVPKDESPPSVLQDLERDVEWEFVLALFVSAIESRFRRSRRCGFVLRVRFGAVLERGGSVVSAWLDRESSESSIVLKCQFVVSVAACSPPSTGLSGSSRSSPSRDTSRRTVSPGAVVDPGESETPAFTRVPIPSRAFSPTTAPNFRRPVDARFPACVSATGSPS